MKINRCGGKGCVATCVLFNYLPVRGERERRGGGGSGGSDGGGSGTSSMYNMYNERWRYWCCRRLNVNGVLRE